MLYILHIETSTKVCSVALSDDKTLIAARTDFSEGFSHSERLAVLIDELFKESGVSKLELSAISVSRGPGSYTGLRIGVSTAKGLAYALGIPLISVNSLHVLANAVSVDEMQQLNTQKVLALMDARRKEVYAGVFLKAEPLVDAKSVVLTNHEIPFVSKHEPVILVGDGSTKTIELLALENAIFLKDKHCLAENMIPLSLANWESKIFEDLAYFEPNYLKPYFTGGAYQT